MRLSPKPAAFRSLALLVTLSLLPTSSLGLRAAEEPAKPAAPSAPGVPALNTQAPDFTLTSGEGDAVSLSKYRGQWVVLYFYPKDFTGGCTLEAHNFQRDLEQYAAAKAVILGVSVDSAESHKSFCAKEGLRFKLLADTDAKVSTLYGSVQSFGGAKLSARNTFLISPRGAIVKTFLGVKPAEHSTEVLAAIRDFQKEQLP